MSKTVGSLLAIVGSAALVATGVGAAAGLALFGTTAGISVAGLGLGTLLTISSVAAALGSALAGGGRASPVESTETSVKNPLSSRVDAFGTSRLYLILACYETAPNGTTVDVGALCEGPADGIVATYLNDTKVTLVGNTVQQLADESYQGGRVKVGWNLGLPTETAFSWIASLIPDRWTSEHRGDGVVTAYLTKAPDKEKYFLETYPQGDNVQLSLVGRWKKVFDWRDPSQNAYDPATWKWSDNAVLCFVWYLMVRRSKDWNTAFAPRLATLTTAANDCDVAMALSAGGTERRYRCCLSYKLTDQPANIIGSYLATFDGWYDTNERGEVIIYSGRYYAPTVSLGPNEIASFSVPYGMPVEDAVNEITVQYVSDLHDYKTVDADSWRDEDAIAASGREPNTADLGILTPSFTQGRRLAKRKMARSRQAPFTITTTIAGDKVIGERYVNVDLTEAGSTFYAGPVEIITAPERDLTTGGVTFQCIPADPSIDAWNPVTEDGLGAPVGTRLNPEPLEPPSITSATTVYAASTDGGTGTKIYAAVDGPDLPGLTWFLRYRRDSSSTWVEQEYTDVDDGADVALLTDFVPLSATTQVEAEYRAVDGRLSGWSDPVTVDTRADVTAPDAAGAVSLDGWGSSIQASTPRISRAASYRWRVYADDGTTLLREIVSATPQLVYTSAQAAADGIRRSYILAVAGTNAAGAGGESRSSVIENPAPAAVTSAAIAGGDYQALATCDPNTEADAAGYVVFYSGTSGFDPATQGGLVLSGNPSIGIYGLSAGTYYGHIAAYDQWTANPALLNLSAEIPFTIAVGGGSTPSGGGTDGGGYGGAGGGGRNPNVVLQ